MLCLGVWSSLDLSQVSKSRTIPCYAKLGGKYVGKLRLCTSTSAYQVLRDIQKQASKLVRHACRGFEDTMVWCDDHCLIPSGFAYRDQMTQEEAEQVWSVLGKAQRFEMMWDDNDEYAEGVLEQSNIHVVCEEVGFVAFQMTAHPCVLPKEVLFAKKMLHGSQTGNKIGVAAPMGGNHPVDIQALEQLRVDALMLYRAEPTSWHACRNIKALAYIPETGIPGVLTPGVAVLTTLEHMFLCNVSALPSDFACLKLKSLELSECHLDLGLLAQGLADMPTLKELKIKKQCRAGSTIPTELGLVESLQRLVLTRNNFVGNIPSELARLTRLTSLRVTEYADFDLVCPQQVLDLNIAQVVVTRP